MKYAGREVAKRPTVVFRRVGLVGGHDDPEGPWSAASAPDEPGSPSQQGGIDRCSSWQSLEAMEGCALFQMMFQTYPKCTTAVASRRRRSLISVHAIKHGFLCLCY
jgi:hypothetical protein